MKPPPTYLDKESFHRLWSSLPPVRCEKSFWVALEAFCETFLVDDCPLRSQEFYMVPHTGRALPDELHFIDSTVLEKCNELRHLYNAFSLWNPLQIASLLKVPISIVVEQFFLAVESNWLNLDFVLSCRSCACDIMHFKSVSEIRFAPTFNSTNSVTCPMCSDVTEIKELSDVSVFFYLDRLHPIFHRAHHRVYCTTEAAKRRLESYFCPAGSGMAINLKLPKGGFLLSAPFMGAMLHLNVEVDAELIGKRDHHAPKLIDLKKYVSRVEPKAPQKSTGRRIGTLSRAAAKRSETEQDTDAFNISRSAADTLAPQLIDSMTFVHGKVQLRIFNGSNSSGFLDLDIAFDPRAEFSAVEYPHQLRLPELLHYLPRGLRSSSFLMCVPRPPSTTLTSGVYCRHIFALPPETHDDPSIIAVLREVHRYSLEDHHGLLLGVSNGGLSFESSFLTVTAALASSICFLQRVLVRLEVNVALSMRCSITDGPLKIATYQGQYNDTENMRSSYPDVQFVGAVIYCSTHPKIQPPIIQTIQMEVSSSNLNRYGLDFPSGTDTGLGSNPYSQPYVQKKSHTMLRFEIRSVPMTFDGMPDYSCGSEPLSGTYMERSNDNVFPYFLNYLSEHFEGTQVVEEPHALVVQMPLPILYASVQMSTVLDRSSYTKEVEGPF